MSRIGVHLNGLRAFEAAARLSSFSKAADELHISHSTVSHHIKGLEQSLGIDLFVRQNRRVVLTQAGRDLVPVLRESFENISRQLDQIKQGDKAPVLRVTVTPSFATKWLVPRLKKFREARPDIDLLVKPSLALSDYRQDRFDVGIRSGLGQWPRLKSELLMATHMSPLCSPDLIAESSALTAPIDVLQHTLLNADTGETAGTASEWHAWLDALGINEFGNPRQLSFEDPALALNAAVDGLGIAMGYVELAADDLAAGRLVQPFAAQIEHPWSYYIVTPEDDSASPLADVFCDWLRAEMWQ
ncbi:MAG: transcriptional regulator GcvA [Pseudomonadota bacterium]